MGKWGAAAVLLLAGFAALFPRTVSWAYMAAFMAFELWVTVRLAALSKEPVPVDEPPYRFSAEVSVYVRQDSHRTGLGRALIEELIVRARALGYHTLIGGASSDQAPSLALQEALGFRPVAHFREVGYKFGLWLDVIYLQLML